MLNEDLLFVMVDSKQKIMDFDFLTNCLTGYCFLDGKGRVNRFSLMQLFYKQKLQGSVSVFNIAGLFDYIFSLLFSNQLLFLHICLLVN